jgi:hypothetical protein
MKKFIVMSALGVAGLISAKTAEVKVSEKKIEAKEKKASAFRLCGVLVTFYDVTGIPSGNQWYLTDASTLSSCQAYQTYIQWQLTQMGYTITP